MSETSIEFFHAPHSRSGGTLALLEELGVDYQLHLLSLAAKQQRQPEYLAVNPMGKVPAILHQGVLVTEQPAIYLYLADLFAERGLAPPMGDPLRGTYLRWLVFYGSCFEPALADRTMKREPAPPAVCPYGDFDTMFKTLTDQLERGPYLLGERFSAADVLWGNALNWAVRFQLVPDPPVLRAYIERIVARPAIRRAHEKDAAFAAAR
jgi:glutathione S-transferase